MASIKTIKTELIKETIAHTITIASEKETPNISTNENLSPMDLFIAAFGSCIVLNTKGFGKSNKIEIKNINTEIDKEMKGKKILKFDIKVYIEGNFSDDQKRILEYAAKYCPVASNLNQDIKKNFNFIYN